MGVGHDRRLERTRAQILEAAKGLFLERGYLPTSMDEVAAATGVSKQTVYAHFRTKEALFLELVDRMTGGAGDTFHPRMADEAKTKTAEAFLIDYAERQLTIVMTPELMRLRRLVIGEVARFPELGRTLHARGPARAIETLRHAMEHFQASGSLKLEDPKKAAAVFNWLVMGEPAHDAMLLGDAGIPSPPALKAHAREAVRVFMAAYGA